MACASELSLKFEKYELIKEIIEKINAKAKTHVLFNKDLLVINGRFVFDYNGHPGAGIIWNGRPKYDHLFGQSVRIDDKDLIQIEQSEKEIKDYFAGLRLVANEKFETV